jgi:hypothetical protein
LRLGRRLPAAANHIPDLAPAPPAAVTTTARRPRSAARDPQKEPHGTYQTVTT